jgi:hypothetical protein
MLLTGLLLGGCMQGTLEGVSDANFTARDRKLLASDALLAGQHSDAVSEAGRLLSITPGRRRLDRGRLRCALSLLRAAEQAGAPLWCDRGRAGAGWTGVAKVGRKAEWPGWVPTDGERKRLGPRQVSKAARTIRWARALSHLYSGDKDTLFRIHGTNQPEYIGQAISSGCIRMTNEDVIDLYDKVKMGSIVVVLGPGQGNIGARMAALGPRS